MKKRYSLNKPMKYLLWCCILFSCDGIFIPDPIDPHLPKYTETGNDVAGAILNDEVWKSRVLFSWYGSGGPTDAPRIHYYSQQDSLVVIFAGQKKGDEHNTYIAFSMLNSGVKKFEDLHRLNTKKFALGSPNYGGYILDQGNYDCITSGTGQVYFRSVRYDVGIGYIISGTFGFDVDDSQCGSIVVRYGRFDYTISNLYFN